MCRPATSSRQDADGEICGRSPVRVPRPEPGCVARHPGKASPTAASAFAISPTGDGESLNPLSDSLYGIDGGARETLRSRRRASVRPRLLVLFLFRCLVSRLLVSFRLVLMLLVLFGHVLMRLV